MHPLFSVEYSNNTRAELTRGIAIICAVDRDKSSEASVAATSKRHKDQKLFQRMIKIDNDEETCEYGCFHDIVTS